MAASSPLCHLGSSACLHRLESGMWATTNPFQDSRECINHRIQFSFRKSKTTGLKRGRRICLIIRSLPDRQTEADNLRIIACKVEVASDNQIKEEILEERKPGRFQPSRRLILGTALVGLIRPLLPIPEAADAVEDDTATSSKKENEPAKSIIGNIVKEKPSRVYDATVLGEPVPMGVDRARLWQKLLAARVVYLGESERVPDPDDKIIELEIVRTLRDKCFEQQRPITLALQAFPSTLQPQLNKYMSKRLSDDELKDFVNYWPKGRWEEHLPLLNYCRDNGVRLMGCGMPLEILRTVQAKGLKGLSQIDRQKYVPPRGGMPFPVVEESTMDLLPKASGAFGPGPYQFAQARVIEDFNMAQVATQAMSDGGSVGLLVVIAGASHVQFGARGSGLPARISKKLQKKTQMVILLNPERQHIRQEGEVPEADLLWYSAAKTCDRNCFDRAEVARVMAAAGRRRDALPQDLQAGLERGIVSPELLQSFFDLEQQPFIAELTKRFQGLRERWFADPRFLQRLAIEETISITTTLLAQYERRKDRFWKELDYVITDTVRGSVVDFFTVWLPAPRLAFRPLDTDAAFPTIFNGLNQMLGSFPDNAFQRAHAGQIWDLKARIIAVAVSGFKLFGVGFISSLGTLTVTNTVLAVRRMFDRQSIQTVGNKRSPVFKTAVVYASFLGTSANLRYQTIAGLVEHWIADYVLASQPMAGNIVSFVARVVNSYWGTQQWIDLARLTGLQAHRDEQSTEISPSTHLEPVSTEINVLPTSANSIIETESDEQYIGKKPEAPFVRRD